MDVGVDGRSVVTGSADHEVKFWDIEEVEVSVEDEEDEDDEDEDDEEADRDRRGGKGSDKKSRKKTEKKEKKTAKTARPAGEVRTSTELVHSRTLKMGDDVMCVRFSKSREPSKALVAVATLDSTVRVFFRDSLKFFLQLYGHKLPVLSMDISDDSSIIATGSADKSLKVKARSWRYLF